MTTKSNPTKDDPVPSELRLSGLLQILDFGLARVTSLPDMRSETSPYVPVATDPGTVLGTVGYMSPEQVRSQPTEASSDLFSFGCVLYEMVTGRRAFQRETAAETMTAILHDEPPDLATAQPVPEELTRLIRQCLAKSVNQRLHSARDLALALRAMASQPAVPASAIPRGVEAVAMLPFENVGGAPRPSRPSSHPLGAPRASRQVDWVAALRLAALIGAAMYLVIKGRNRSDADKQAPEASAVEAVLPPEWPAHPADNERRTAITTGAPLAHPKRTGAPPSHRLSTLSEPQAAR